VWWLLQIASGLLIDQIDATSPVEHEREMRQKDLTEARYVRVGIEKEGV
jgi:hypothetical protein